MMECAHCGRLFPEVVGAPEQVCPHCGHEMAGDTKAPSPRHRAHVDPVGAIGEAARVGARHYPFLLLVFLPALLIEIGVGFATEAYVARANLPEDVESYTTAQAMQLLGVSLPLTLLLYTARFACWTLVAARVLDVMLGGARLAQWRALLGPALLLGFVLTLTYGAGILLVGVGFFVFLHWFAYAPAQLAAGAGGLGAAFDRSRRFAREQRTYGFTALLVLVGACVLVPYFLADRFGGTLGVLVPALIAWVGGPLVPLLVASYVGLAMREGAPPRPAPSAAEVVRASTKCPRCAALIPYTPTGAPVDVVCPACGNAGRVL